MGAGEVARYWRHPDEPGVDLLAARYVRHAFGRHSHDTYAIGVVLDGVEEFLYDGSVERAAAGQMPLVNPGVVHTGHAGTPHGWTYRVLYPSVEFVAEVAADLGAPPGTPAFTTPVIADPEATRLLLSAHRAAELELARPATPPIDDPSPASTNGLGTPPDVPVATAVGARPGAGDATSGARGAGGAVSGPAVSGGPLAVGGGGPPAGGGGGLAASSLLRLLVAALLRRHARVAGSVHEDQAGAGREAAALAREVLHARMAEPPRLEELAAEVGARPFPLLRAFRDRYGLPPHAYLNQERVRAARRLLDAGTPVADSAYAVGFVDQAHLTRHFRRVLGITPGAYRRTLPPPPHSP